MSLDNAAEPLAGLLDLQGLIHSPDAKISCQFSLDLSTLEFFGDFPIQNPVEVSATVTNHAGALVLEGQVSSTLQVSCDRCNVHFAMEKVVTIDSLLADHLEDEENDEIILLEGSLLNLNEVATSAFILAMDTKKLCSEQCKGLCANCGADLNQNPCACKVVPDSPFAALAQLLDD